MHTHVSRCLKGPRTKNRGWWQHPAVQGSTPEDKHSSPPPGREEQPIRTDLVERVRRELAAGTYETPEKWEAALDRLLRRLEG
jgi:negative regulator of flagellin synthesis FlgM